MLRDERGGIRKDLIDLGAFHEEYHAV